MQSRLGDHPGLAAEDPARVVLLDPLGLGSMMDSVLHATFRVEKKATRAQREKHYRQHAPIIVNLGTRRVSSACILYYLSVYTRSQYDWHPEGNFVKIVTKKIQHCWEEISVGTK